MEKKIKKEYKGNKITVVWQPDLCIHSTNCWRGLNEVFDPKKRPWINMEGADEDKIAAQVKNCPSGALSFYQNNARKAEDEIATATAKVRVSRNGPLLYEGDITVIHQDGREENRSGTTALCRCGGSENKPFCDGSHRKIDFLG